MSVQPNNAKNTSHCSSYSTSGSSCFRPETIVHMSSLYMHSLGMQKKIKKSHSHCFFGKWYKKWLRPCFHICTIQISVTIYLFSIHDGFVATSNDSGGIILLSFVSYHDVEILFHKNFIFFALTILSTISIFSTNIQFISY